MQAKKKPQVNGIDLDLVYAKQTISAPRYSMDFRRLQQIWYQKLKDETDFKDIENEYDNSKLKSWHNFQFKRYLHRHAGKESYFQNCRDILNHYPFKKQIHKTIWEMHSEGLSVRHISKQIGTIQKSGIHKIIKMIAQNIKGLR
jgi:hypothetical protein